MVLHCNPLGKLLAMQKKASKSGLSVNALLKTDNEKERSHQKRKRDRAKERKKVAGAGKDDDVRPAQHPRRNTAGGVTCFWISGINDEKSVNVDEQ